MSPTQLTRHFHLRNISVLITLGNRYMSCYATHAIYAAFPRWYLRPVYFRKPVHILLNNLRGISKESFGRYPTVTVRLEMAKKRDYSFNFFLFLIYIFQYFPFFLLSFLFSFFLSAFLHCNLTRNIFCSINLVLWKLSTLLSFCLKPSDKLFENQIEYLTKKLMIQL